ncbi:hypothetical protein [[Kitasatospora] papulosa]|uniref:hypothetical protein n=1 Tax=[Kitasatospora] papulosa TaxID=1464011 RepID=UPI003681F19A
MSEEESPDEAWDEVAESWRIDELVEGRLMPATNDDVLTLAAIGALRMQPPLKKDARRQALAAMLAAAASGAEPHSSRDPARIEETLQTMLQRFREVQQRGEE